MSVEELCRALVQRGGVAVSLLDQAVQPLVAVVLFRALVLGLGRGPFPAGDGTLSVTTLTHGRSMPLAPHGTKQPRGDPGSGSRLEVHTGEVNRPRAAQAGTMLVATHPEQLLEEARRLRRDARVAKQEAAATRYRAQIVVVNSERVLGEIALASSRIRASRGMWSDHARPVPH
jgi:hypothetical protein